MAIIGTLIKAYAEHNLGKRHEDGLAEKLPDQLSSLCSHYLPQSDFPGTVGGAGR